jgi:hypothetical protein
MRALQPEELDIVAGGAGDTSSKAPIYVTGTRPPSIPPLPIPGSGGGGGGGGGGIGVGGPVAKQTPCVDTSFDSSDASLQAANNAALAASNSIAAQNDETFEYSSIVWSLNGQVGWTQPFTNHLTDQVNFLGGIGQVPSGAVILGIVHNHPDIPGINDTIPSPTAEGGADWQAYSQLQSWAGTRGITVDDNALLWIYSDEDGKTHVYDNTDRETQHTSCSLQ